ncbi:hypothetical protein GA0070612_1154 [Micromonospora chokoriensis]|uniref:Uncharacterized protein n=1 Tax=Micromonospora chokoriensis TaxID=356851 RepID=A0A1C4V7K1_9ACTN|nr:hypothetical protein GA0070612_1154 [Micromonospora chokoriensis]
MAAGSKPRSEPAGGTWPDAADGTRPGPPGGTRPGALEEELSWPAAGRRSGAAGETGAAGEPVGRPGPAVTCGMIAVGESATDDVEGADGTALLGVPEGELVGIAAGAAEPVEVGPGIPLVAADRVVAAPGDAGRAGAAPGDAGRVGAAPGDAGRVGIPWGDPGPPVGVTGPPAAGDTGRPAAGITGGLAAGGTGRPAAGGTGRPAAAPGAAGRPAAAAGVAGPLATGPEATGPDQGGRVGALPGTAGRSAPWSVGLAGLPEMDAEGRPDPACGPGPWAVVPGQGGGASAPGRPEARGGSWARGGSEARGGSGGRGGSEARAGSKAREGSGARGGLGATGGRDAPGSTGSGQLPAGVARPGVGSGRSTFGRMSVGSSVWLRCRPSRRSSDPLTWAPSPSAGRSSPRMPALAPWKPSPCNRVGSRRPRP